MDSGLWTGNGGPRILLCLSHYYVDASRMYRGFWRNDTHDGSTPDGTRHDGRSCCDHDSSIASLEMVRFHPHGHVRLSAGDIQDDDLLSEPVLSSEVDASG